MIGALFDVLTGRVRPIGRLPFELPRSMEAVARAAAPMYRMTVASRCTRFDYRLAK